MHQVGPMSLDDLMAGGITGDTMVWREGLEEWAKAGNLPDVVAALERRASAEKPASVERPASVVSVDNPDIPEEAEAPASAEPAVIADDDDILPERPSKRLGLNITMMVLTTLNPFYVLGLLLVMPFAILSITFGAIGESAYNRENYRLAARFGGLGRGFSKAALICGLIILLLEILFFVAIING